MDNEPQPLRAAFRRMQQVIDQSVYRLGSAFTIPEGIGRVQESNNPTRAQHRAGHATEITAVNFDGKSSLLNHFRQMPQAAAIDLAKMDRRKSDAGGFDCHLTAASAEIEKGGFRQFAPKSLFQNLKQGLLDQTQGQVAIAVRSGRRRDASAAKLAA